MSESLEGASPGISSADHPQSAEPVLPALSVLTPSFGYARFIEDAILSVQEQGRSDVEHIIMDGASTDGTTDVLSRYPALKWRSEPDRGQSDALNKALREASAPIIAWLNADEFYLDGTFDRVLRLFEQTDADVIYGDAIFCDEGGHFLRLLPQLSFDRFTLRTYGPFLPSSALFLKREVLRNDPWDIDAHHIMDWDLYLRLAEDRLRIRYVPIPFGVFRVHDARVTARPIRWGDPEHLRIRARHGINTVSGIYPAVRAVGRTLHIAKKAMSGSYARQWRARGQRGKDLRWW